MFFQRMEIREMAALTRRCLSHICEYYGISEKSEEAAYLIGDLVEELYTVFKYELGKS